MLPVSSLKYRFLHCCQMQFMGTRLTYRIQPLFYHTLVSTLWCHWTRKSCMGSSASLHFCLDFLLLLVVILSLPLLEHHPTPPMWREFLTLCLSPPLQLGLQKRLAEFHFHRVTSNLNSNIIGGCQWNLASFSLAWWHLLWSWILTAQKSSSLKPSTVYWLFPDLKYAIV